MALGFLRGRSKAQPPPPQAPDSGAAAARGPAPTGGGLAQLIQQTIALQAEREAVLKKGIADGVKFYSETNDSRLQLAFDSFDPDMQKALFELMFLLHVNEPSLSKVTYPAFTKDNSSGVPRWVQREQTKNFYVEGAPHGIRGLSNLSGVFRGEFEKHIQAEFGRPVPRLPNEKCVIVCLQSIGSIGTVGHKSGESDLDLQVIYDLYPLAQNSSNWSDDTFRAALKADHSAWLSEFMSSYKITKSHLQDPEVRQKLHARSAQYLSKNYPMLYKYLIQGSRNYRKDLAQAKGPALRVGLSNELMRLMESHARISNADKTRAEEELFIKRVAIIQQYIGEKYHTAEIYMFACAVDLYRAGKYTSSLEFKESSGSAYELILNYETLMPGIQFTPTIPSHFVFPHAVNNDAGFYQRLHTYIKFDSLDIYRKISPVLVDLGHTPDMDVDYVADHRGAVYWEAFKASSGNLPKATLNLLRYEMLLEERYLKTIMQIIKEPGIIDDLISPKPHKEQQIKEALENEDTGMPNWIILELEAEHPMLLQDPWWLRYKALKVGFSEPAGVPGLNAGERRLVSKCIDLAFALHVRISDVFTKPGDTRQLDSHRELVLQKFLSYAFPPGTDKRAYLNHIFAGEVQAVNLFESDLRAVFRRSLERTQNKIGEFDIKSMRRNSEEIKLWHNYYEEHFEPKPNVVQRTILNHLKTSRGRLQIGFVIGEGWYFKSLQRESGVGKRFDTFGVLDHLPDEVTLLEGTGFLMGLASCIVNGYYGIIKKGTLKESRTALELDRKSLKLGDRLDEETAFLQPDLIDRMVDQILEFFPYEYHNYMDYLRVPRRVARVFVFLNIWKFGRLSILYRDNLSTWYCDEFDHPEMKKNAQVYRGEYKAMVTAAPVLHSLDRFMRDHTLYIDEVELATWVNPNSTETTHPSYKPVLREEFLSEAFREAIMESQPKKGG
ncbi:MAG: hypothetical protein O7E56_07430 [SAR324 cluster bacterium]|nr:hypothetical protein [SAR324 cluster bacterium]